MQLLRLLRPVITSHGAAFTPHKLIDAIAAATYAQDGGKKDLLVKQGVQVPKQTTYYSASIAIPILFTSSNHFPVDNEDNSNSRILNRIRILTI